MSSFTVINDSIRRESGTFRRVGRYSPYLKRVVSMSSREGNGRVFADGFWQLDADNMLILHPKCEAFHKDFFSRTEIYVKQ